MKWYTCLNEDGLTLYRDHLKIAIASCRACTSLDPHVVFDGDPETLIDAVGRQDFTIHQKATALWPDIIEVAEGPGFKHRIASGAFLRMEIANLEQTEDFVLYTDCDVLFCADVDFSKCRPRLIAAAPEADQTDWSSFSSGVMILNVAAARNDYLNILGCARRTLGIPHFYDQGVYNKFYKDKWDRLPLVMHWKPYWGINKHALIVHFHGPKIHALRYLIDDVGTANIHAIWREMFDRDKESYLEYYRLSNIYI